MTSITRRDALQRLAALLGGTLSAPLVAGVLNGCRPERGAWSPQTLTSHQNELVTHLSEMIIPATDTPGAEAAQVNRFVDLMLTDWYPADAVTHFRDGLDAVDPRAREAYGAPFLDCSTDEQTDLLTALAREAEQASEREHPPFFSMMKELTMVGYYTSEIGRNQELAYRIVPGRHDGCVPVEDVYPHLGDASAPSA